MTLQDQFIAFIARLCLVLIFPFSALDKIFNHQSAMAQAAHGLIALPDSMAALLLVLGGMLEIIGPVCILVGFYRRQAALLFVFYVVVTAVLFHNFWAVPPEAYQNQQINFLKNVAIMGGMLMVFAFGPGRLSVDRESPA